MGTEEKEVKVPRVEKDPRVDTVLLIHGVDTTKDLTHGVDTTVLQTHGVDTTVEKEEKDPRDSTHGVDTTKTTMMITTHGVDTTVEKEEKVPRVEKAVKVEREEKGTTDLMMITPCTMITIISTVIVN